MNDTRLHRLRFPSCHARELRPRYAPPTFDLISPSPGQPNNRGSNQDGSSVSLSSARRVIGIK
jgi:hypothetical protein